MKLSTVFTTASAMIVGAGILRSFFLLFIGILFVIVMFAYHRTMNVAPNRQNKSFVKSMLKASRRRRIKQRGEARKKLMREKFAKPRPLRMFIPFFI